jgi:Cache domain
MTLSVAGTRLDAGVSVAMVSLKLMWDVVSQIKVGEHGQAYVIDGDGRLIAHPDISLVLRNTDMSKLAQVQAARTVGTEPVQEGQDIHGNRVLSVHAPVSPLGWLVFVELPIEEAYASLYDSIKRSGAIIFTGLMLAFLSVLFLARRMVVSIQTPRNPDQGPSA